MYVGNDRMVHSPATGQVVSVVKLLTPNAAARRYLP